MLSVKQVELTSLVHAGKMREEIDPTVVTETCLEVVTGTPLEAVTDTEKTVEDAETKDPLPEIVVEELQDEKTNLKAGDVLTVVMTDTVLVQSRHTRTP